MTEPMDLMKLEGIVLPGRDVTPPTKFHRLNVQRLQFDVEHAHRVGRAKIGGKWQPAYMHSNPQLDMFLVAAGVEITKNEPVPANHEHIYRHHFACRIVLPSGKGAPGDCWKTVDLRSLDEGGTRAARSLARRQDELRDALTGEENAKWPKGLDKPAPGETDEEVMERAELHFRNEVEREMIDARVFGAELAEAGAKSRVVRDVFGLRMQLSKDEIQQPVWVVTSVFDTEKALEDMAGTEAGKQMMGLLALAEAQAMGQTVGGEVEGGKEALAIFQSLQQMTPDKIEAAVAIHDDNGETIEGEAVILPTDEPPPPDDVQELADEIAAGQPPPEIPLGQEDGGMKLIGQMKRYLAGCGYNQYAQNNLLEALWEGTFLTISRRQARSTMQYAKRATESKEPDMSPAQFKAVKDGLKVLARMAEKCGEELNEYLDKAKQDTQPNGTG